MDLSVGPSFSAEGINPRAAGTFTRLKPIDSTPFCWFRQGKISKQSHLYVCLNMHNLY